MKKLICLAAGLLTVTFTLASGQPAAAPPTPRAPTLPTPPPRLVPPPQSPGTFSERLQTVVNRNAASQNQAPALTKFDLDFPGGTPAELVKAIEKASGKPLNAIISEDDATVQLPPLKMNHVDVAQLFQALEAASQKTVSVIGPYSGSYQQQRTGYSFQTTPQTLSDDSIWYFHVEKPSLPPVIASQKVCRFYSLDIFLRRGFTVDDITTAIQTGWKMSGVHPLPELNYHKETKLLIAFGEPRQLGIIDSVLQSLPSSNATRALVDEMNDLKSDLQRLRSQVDKLTKKVSTLTLPAGSPEEKSGK